MEGGQNKKEPEQKIEYAIRTSKRARRMRLVVYCDGNIVLTVPRSMNQNTIEKFIAQKSKWILEKLEYFKPFTPVRINKSTKADYLKYKDQAQALAEERVAHFNEIYKFTFNKINIRNPKARWGSCSKKGNMNFNYKIALLPADISDYIIVHEMCHLGEFNHSRKFWNLVAQTVPNYLEIRKELKSGV